jgi:hypothetical protein
MILLLMLTLAAAVCAQTRVTSELKCAKAELMVFYCERAAGFCSDIGNEDESYFAALVRIFEQALTVANTLPASGRAPLVARLDRVRGISQKFGYGVGDDVDFIFAKYTKRRN